MRLASYNVENLFARAKVLNTETWEEGRPVLEAFARFNALISEARYTAARKEAMVELLHALDLDRSDDGQFVRLLRNRGEFLVRRRNPPRIEILAEGRAEWNGWLELEREPVDDTAMRLTARVIADVGADVIGIVEAESRPALKGFSDRLLRREGGAPYRHVMLIDGNDPRGIDCAIMTREGFPIAAMRSNVDYADERGEVFSRDCPEYTVETPAGARLTVLVNHFKSKGFGRQADSNAKRRRQAEAVARIYRGLREAGAENLAVLGDLNDAPPEREQDPLHPLLAGTDLRDISTLPGHDSGGRPGTFGESRAAQKFDYILLSPALAERAGASGVFRRGMWPGTSPAGGGAWEVYPELDPAQGGRKFHAASDHGALWVELDL